MKTSKGALFLPPSDAYVRSFLYLLYTLIKLHYTEALSDPSCLWPRIEYASSGGQESRHLIVQQQPVNFMAKRWGNNGNSERLSFLGLQNHCRW